MAGHVKGYTKTKLLRANLYKVRTKMGLTCGQLADRVGLNKGYYVRIENGVQDPSYDTMLSICKALSVTSNQMDLFEIFILTNNLNDEEHKVLEMLQASGDGLSEKQRDTLIKYIRCNK